jgi:hypothetical protein
MADTPKRAAGPGEVSEETGQPAGGPVGVNVTSSGPVAGAPSDQTDPEPEDERPANKCAKCGAEFSGEGARADYREHMASFHPAA